MSGPWAFDEDEIPEDGRTRARRRKLQYTGVVMWGLFISALIVLLAADTGDLTRTETVALGALSVGTAVVAVGVGALLLLLFRYFEVLGRILVGLAGLFAFFVLLPTMVSFVIEHVSLFDGLSSGSETSVQNLIQLLLEQ